MKLTMEVNEEANQLTITMHGVDGAKCPGEPSFYQTELQIQVIVAAVGRELTRRAMAARDETALRIAAGPVVYYQKQSPSRGHYKTLYGDIEVTRHLYQTAGGGATICPLEGACQMREFGSATPLLAEVIAFKAAAMTPREVAADLQKCHRVTAAPSFIDETAQRVGQIGVEKKAVWELARTGTDAAPVAVIATGMDGTTVPLVDEQYKVAMAGTIARYNQDEERLATEYLGAMPEAGRANFFQHFDTRVDRVLAQHPQAQHVVLCDGERSQWDHLEAKYPEATHILDICHAQAHVAAAAEVIFGPPVCAAKTAWYARQCSNLKEESDGAARLIREVMRQQNKLWDHPARAMALEQELTYFHHNAPRMKYALYRALGFPIGSGVTEAACKTLIKQRLCRSGMRWKRPSGGRILQLRAIRLSNYWNTFWFKVMRYVA